MAVEEIDANAALERVQRLSEALEALDDGHAKQVGESLVAAIVELYGEGLQRIVATLADAGEPGRELHERLVADGVVASLLLVHDLYPVGLEERVREGLEMVRPYMESHGGDVELLGLDDGVARLRLVGSCKGCPASQATLEHAIEEALSETAPDLLGLEVEGVTEAPARGSDLLQITQVGDEPEPPATPTWMPLDGAPQVGVGSLETVEVHGVELIVANVEETLLAYRSRCAGCGAGLGDATLEGGHLRCAGCERVFDLPHAGRALGDDALQIDPVPLLRRAR